MSKTRFTAKTVNKLLKELNSFIDNGYEFCDAIDQIIDEYSLTKNQIHMLMDVYDSQPYKGAYDSD